jgi:hypothetical protein
MCPVLTPAQKLMAKIHELIHEASFALSTGEIDKVSGILAEVDKLSHDNEGIIH